MPEQVEVTIVENKIPALVARVEAVSRAGVKRVADKIARTAQQNAPYVTGTLHDSITSTSVSIGREAEVYVGAPYGGYVEFGTRFMAAEPYLGPAVDEHTPDLPEEIMVAFEAPL